MRRIAITNQKGGVGKTTTAANVGTALARAGHRVLLVDLDPQAHLTLHLGQEPTSGRTGIYEMLTGSATVAKARRKVAANLWLVGSSIDLAGAEVELVSVVGREVILRDLLNQHLRPRRTGLYDYVLMDCPPSLGVLTLNGLCAAGEVFIPLQPHYLALQGLGKLLETLALVSTRINPTLTVAGLVVCMNEAGTKLAAEVTEDVRSFFAAARDTNVPWASTRVCETVIRRNIKLAEAPSYGKSIFDYAPDSNGAKDYEQLALEIHDPAAFSTPVWAVGAPATIGTEDQHQEAAPKEQAEPIQMKTSAASPAPAAEVQMPGQGEPATTGGEQRNADPALTEPVRLEPLQSLPRKRRTNPRAASTGKTRRPSTDGKAATGRKKAPPEPIEKPPSSPADSPLPAPSPTTGPGVSQTA